MFCDTQSNTAFTQPIIPQISFLLLMLILTLYCKSTLTQVINALAVLLEPQPCNVSETFNIHSVLYHVQLLPYNALTLTRRLHVQFFENSSNQVDTSLQTGNLSVHSDNGMVTHASWVIILISSPHIPF